MNTQQQKIAAINKDSELFPFFGVHIVAELFGIDSHVLDNETFLSSLLQVAIDKCSATLCGIQSKRFLPHGVTVLALLAESHASFHSYPEKESLFLDIFTCGSVDPLPAFYHIVDTLHPKSFNLKNLKRGNI